MNFSVIVPFFRRKNFLDLFGHLLKGEFAFSSSLNIFKEVAIASESEDVAKDGFYIAKVIGKRR